LRELDVPDCGCPVFDRCPECGAAGTACILHCKLCDAEWPEKATHCPGCGVPAKPYVLYQPENPARPRRIRKMVLRARCPLHTSPRPMRPPCEHVLARDHTLTLEEWAILLLASNNARFHPRSNPDTFADMPKAPRPAQVIRRQARVALREWRCGRFALWHPDDLDQRQVDGLEMEGDTKRNGRLCEETRLIVRKGGGQ